MAKFPLEYNYQDSTSAVEAVNYLLSGPAGLGQNFAGYSNYNTVYLTGNFQSPFTTNSVSVNTRAASGATTLYVDTTTGISTGNYVTGPGIATGTLVTAVNLSAKTVTVSLATTQSVSGQITYSPSQTAALYVAPMSITGIVWLSPYALRVNFTPPGGTTTPPFGLGNPVTISGATPAVYNITYTGAGVIETGTNFVVIRHQQYIANPGSGSGGTISYSNTVQPPAAGQVPVADNWTSTDCIGNVTVTGATDRVFISGQIDQSISYTATAASDLRITVAVNRYKTTTNTNTGNITAPTLVYQFDKSVAERVYLRTGLTGSGTITPNIDTVFGTFIDTPDPGYYQYRLEVLYRVTNDTGACQVNESKIDVRTLALQVVKQ